MSDPLLSLRSVGITGPQGPIVGSVSFDVSRGATVALVGESGVGKSLLTLALLGLLPAQMTTSGAAVFTETGTAQDDSAPPTPIDLLALKPDAARRFRLDSVGVVFQEPGSAFDPLHRIGRQIGEVLGVRTGIRGSARHDKVVDLLTQARLDEPERIARSYPHQVSGGQLQRAMVAMALSHEPALLIADEPTTALDTRVQAEILDLLRTLQSERDLTTLLVTHDMGVVADCADSVVVLAADSASGSTVAESGPVERVLLSPQHSRTRELVDAVARLDGSAAAVAVKKAVPAPGSSTSVPVATLTDVTVRYAKDEAPALDSVSLTVGAGETVALVGESGAGKSTLGRILIGLQQVSSGTATVAGVDVRRLSTRARRSLAPHIGVVFQDPGSSLNPEHSVGDSLELPLRIHTDLDRGQRAERVAELLGEVGLDPAFATRHPRELSGGQRQRVALARALATGPSLLVADEPTSALDAKTQRSVLELLAQLRMRHGFASVIITHNLAVAEAVADRIVVLRNGVVVEDGRTADVLTNPDSSYAADLIAATPVADPIAQRERRTARR
ncbi:ABC transporter ATP-binding protein [Williamsia sp. CHRR-6]|uniref:ATP-binding cassette domain-containing protein n=1 Tax=Williamsia sp. CHRR-6 TaxID=2835871 RepID=UPI001BDA5A12|nr:ABC transporter ATP-binding protein [Williamsia sp. CHRR-6]MBT0565867.1 ABC transporter ATP-binding protein [Williamsia sp. CHRR-6]